LIAQLRGRLVEGWALYRWELAAVAAVFVVTVVYLGVQVLRVKSYVWLVDELLYTKAAQGFGSGTLHATVFSQPYSVPNVLYSVLLAPAYGVLSNPHAFTAAHLFNAVVFASTLVPVYLLARRMGATPVAALLGAALAVWIPWSVAATVLMSESLAYPLLAWAVLAVVVAVENPRPRNDVLALVALGAALLARTQFLFLGPLFVAAIVFHELTWPKREPGDLRGRMRRHWLLAAAVVVGLLVALIAQPAVLGSYGGTAHVERLPGGLADSMAEHLGRVIIGCGIVPALFWTAWLVRGGGAPVRRADHIFAFVSGIATFAIVYEAGFFSRQIAGGRPQERYMFYVVALFAAATGALVSDRRRPGPIGSLIGAGILAIPFVGAVDFPGPLPPFEIVASGASGYNDKLISAMSSLAPGWTTRGAVAVAVVVIAVLAAVAFNSGSARRIAVPLLAALGLLFALVQTVTVLDRVISGINAAIPSVVGNAPKAWVDGLVFRGGEKAGVIEGYGDQSDQWLWTEFWNSRLTRVYSVGGRTPFSGLPSTPLTVDQATGRMATPNEMPLLVVSAGDPSLAVRGTPIRTISTGQRLLRPARPYQADWIYGDGGTDSVTEKPTPLSAYPPKPTLRRATVDLDLLASTGKGRPIAWMAQAGGRLLASGAVAHSKTAHVHFAVPVEPGAKRASATLSAPRSGKAPLLLVRNVSVHWKS
jgi:hypothetical protein